MARPRGATTRRIDRGNGRYRMWQSMRIKRVFTVPFLVATAEVTETNASKYLHALSRAGFVRQERAPVGRTGGHGIWRLLRDSGPDAPRAQRSGGIWDPNTDTTYGGTSAWNG